MTTTSARGTPGASPGGGGGCPRRATPANAGYPYGGPGLEQRERRWPNVRQGADNDADHCGHMSFRLQIALVSAMLALAAASPAQASSVSVSGSTLSFAAADGEANDVTVTLSGGAYVVADVGATLSPGTCTPLSPNSASCTATGITALSLDARDRDDRITVVGATVPVTLLGAEGDDQLAGGDGADTISGGAGADRLDGGLGN